MKSNPLVSFCIFTYNQESFVLDALNGAVSQTYDNMEIIVSDDCSKDNTYEIVKAFFANYEGPHKILLNQNKYNLGIREHFNFVNQRLASGDVIVSAAGDDKSLPDRVKIAVSVLQKYPEVVSVFFDSIQTDSNLRPYSEYNSVSKGLMTVITLDDYIERLNKDFWNFSGDSRVFRKEILNSYPPLSISNNEDLPFFMRSIILGSIAFIREPAVLRRNHEHNISKVIRIKQEGHNLFKQLELDINYAREKGYINNNGLIGLKRKISSIKRRMIRKDVVFLYAWMRPLYEPIKKLFQRIH